MLVAWEFDGATIETRAAAEINALPKGPPVRKAPFLVKGSGPEVFLIDDALDSAVPGADAGTGDDAAVNPAANPEELNGCCGCRTVPSRAPSGFALGLAVALVATSRRRRSRHHTGR